MSSDIIVIGGGIVGLSTAHELLRLGATVTLLERNRCGREASWAGAGILSPLLPWDYSDPVTQLARLSNGLYPQFIETLRAETGIDPEYEASGMLVLEPSPDSEGPEEQAESARRAAIAEHWCMSRDFPLQKVRSREVESALAHDQAALRLPDICQVRNPRLLGALLAAVKKSGTILENAEVVDWEIASNRVQSVTTRNGEKHAAAVYVVAAGAWSRVLLGEHAHKLEIWPVRGQILLFKAQEGLVRAIVVKDRDNFYLIPRRDGHVLAGSTIEQAGFDNRITSQARETLLAQAHTLVPGLREETLVAHWAGLRPGSMDNIPVIDRHPALSNLYLNGGHYRYGVTMAPASAQLAVNLILNKPQPLEAAPYRWGSGAIEGPLPSS